MQASKQWIWLGTLAWLFSIPVQALLPAPTKRIIHQQQVSLAYPLHGYLTAGQHAQLAFEASGLIEYLAVDIGDQVKKDQLLIGLHCEEQKQKSLLTLAQRKRADVVVKQAKREVVRIQDLYRQGHMDTQSVERAEDRLQLTLADLDIAVASHALSSVQQAKCSIKAPWDGVVVDKQVDVGQYVGAGREVMQLQSLDIQVAAQVPSRFVKNPTLDQRRASVDIQGSQILLTLISSASQLPLNSLSVPSEWSITNMKAIEDSAKLVGSSLTIKLEHILNQPGFWLDRSAVTQAFQGTLDVLVIREGKVEVAQVNLIHQDTGRVYVSGPLENGLEYIHEGVQLYSAGQLVKSSPVEVLR